MSRVWQEWMDGVLRDRYADEENAVLAKELGVGLRTVERHASWLGLRKSEAYIAERQRLAAAGAKRWVEWMVASGRKVQKRYGGGGFKKGNKLPAEVEAKRIKAIRDRAWDERVRIIHGVARKTGWRMVDYSTGEKV